MTDSQSIAVLHQLRIDGIFSKWDAASEVGELVNKFQRSSI